MLAVPEGSALGMNEDDREYQVTLVAWYLANIALLLAIHRQHHQHPWL